MAAARHSWKGYLQLNLVTIAVRAYSAGSDEQPIQFDQLHAECKSRILQATATASVALAQEVSEVSPWERRKSHTGTNQATAGA